MIEWIEKRGYREDNNWKAYGVTNGYISAKRKPRGGHGARITFSSTGAAYISQLAIEKMGIDCPMEMAFVRLCLNGSGRPELYVSLFERGDGPDEAVRVHLINDDTAARFSARRLAARLGLPQSQTVRFEVGDMVPHEQTVLFPLISPHELRAR